MRSLHFNNIIYYVAIFAIVYNLHFNNIICYVAIFAVAYSLHCFAWSMGSTPMDLIFASRFIAWVLW